MSLEEGTEGGMEFYDLPSTSGRRAFGAFVLRAAGSPEAPVPAVKERLWTLDADLPLPRVSTVAERYRARLERPRFYVSLMSVFAVVATVLAGAGIFAVVAYTVSRRTREIGIRMALGARRGTVLRLVVRGVLVTALAGVAVGVAGALALGRFLEGLVFGVAPADPATLIAVSLLLLGVTLAASWVPARRAVRVDPVRAVASE
jgi:putative ABC transport system permease protein